MEEKKENILDFTKIVPMLLKRWKLYALYIVGSIAFSIAFVFTIPRYYTCQVMLAPEASSGGGMNSLLSSFGFGEAQTTDDAISPNLYPDLMQSKDFIVSMFSVEITTKDGNLTTTYYDYLLHHNKNVWYMRLIGKLKKALESKEPEVSVSEMRGRTFSPAFLLSEEQSNIAGAIANKIQCNYDKKTGVISVTVQDQDPLVCALIADTVSSRLQDFILDYRTKKARNDLEYTQRIYAQTKADYEESNERYVAAVDANWDIVNETAKARLEALSNDKSLKYQTFSTASQKLEAAKAKLQEATPVTTILQGASVPQKPAGPRRLLITVAFMIFAGFFCSVYLINTDKSWKGLSQ
ncbi:MAG: chain-length determining protein [Bacteroidaceae bacterium]|nr:chain-length determining protein [Bacteroidaceae bacterium]